MIPPVAMPPSVHCLPCRNEQERGVEE
jgi:hypothetical protein